MKGGQKLPALDGFRLVAAFLVVCIHTSPFASWTELGDFWLTRVLARVAVPFFFMTSGYFLACSGWRGFGRTMKKLLLLYGCAILLYLPLNWYNGGFTPLQWLQKLLVDGTFYHLWYFPAVLLGLLISRQAARLGMPAALILAALLYLVGLAGDSYYGLAARIPVFAAGYDKLFAISSYTRNGLFFAPLFILMGAAGYRLRPRMAMVGLLLTLTLMSVEGFVLHAGMIQRHDSMYIFLPLVMLCLFSLLLTADGCRRRDFQEISLLVYLLHPWCIVLVRGAAKLLGLEAILIYNSLGHFAAVLLGSICAAFVLERLRPARPEPHARAWRETDLAAVVANAKTLQAALAPGCRLMAVVKADAYGHGALAVARALRRRAGIRAFAVSCLQEGIALRRHGVRGTILILGYTPPDQARQLFCWRLTQAVVDEAHGAALAARGWPLHVHVALDTGMHRLGVPAEDTAAIARLFTLPCLRIDGVFSHLCVADSREQSDIAYTQGQLEAFYAALRALRASGHEPGTVHIQASYGIWNLQPQPCGFARAGIALYGVRSNPAPVEHPLPLQPVLALRARIAAVRDVRAGDAAGYGLAFCPQRDSRLAVISVGYGDGLPRELPQKGGQVLICGQRCPMVGWLCMDQLLADVTDLPQVAAGDVATLIGRDGMAELSAEEIAACCGMLTNELLSQLSARLPVIPVGNRRTIHTDHGEAKTVAASGAGF